MKPYFMININYHSDENYEEHWKDYDLYDYMIEYDLDVDALNEMMKKGAIELSSFEGMHPELV